MLPSYFDYIFVYLRQKARLRSELSPKFLSTLGPNPARTRPRKARPDLNSVPYCLPSRATTCKGMLYVAKLQYKLRVASGLNVPLYESMKWNMKENFSIEWKIFSMKWKWNERKLPVSNIEKSSSFPYQALPVVMHLILNLNPLLSELFCIGALCKSKG